MLTISLPSDVVRRLTQALHASGERECGGVLMAEHCGHNQFVVRQVTIQRAGSIISFLREVGDAVRHLREFFSTTNENYVRFNYLGEWHSHPLFLPEPSTLDHASMRQIVQDPKVGANFVVLLVLKLDSAGKLVGSAHTYLQDGAVYRSNLLIERT